MTDKISSREIPMKTIWYGGSVDFVVQHRFVHQPHYFPVAVAGRFSDNGVVAAAHAKAAVTFCNALNNRILDISRIDDEAVIR